MAQACKAYVFYLETHTGPSVCAPGVRSLPQLRAIDLSTWRLNFPGNVVGEARKFSRALRCWMACHPLVRLAPMAQLPCQLRSSACSLPSQLAQPKVVRSCARCGCATLHALTGGFLWRALRNQEPSRRVSFAELRKRLSKACCARALGNKPCRKASGCEIPIRPDSAVFRVSCRVLGLDDPPWNVVESTRNVVESTTFSTFTGKMTKVVNSCRVDFRPNRREMYSRRHFQCSTGKGKSCQIHEKCCRVDEIFGNVVEPARNVVESATYSNFHSDPTTILEMLSNRREMLSSGRHGEWC